jgi:hypothetical protein
VREDSEGLAVQEVSVVLAEWEVPEVSVDWTVSAE